MAIQGFTADLTGASFLTNGAGVGLECAGLYPRHRAGDRGRGDGEEGCAVEQAATRMGGGLVSWSILQCYVRINNII